MTTVNQAVKKLIAIDTDKVKSTEAHALGLSSKQRDYAIATAELSIELGAKFEDVIAGIESERKSLVSKTKCWADPKVAPVVEKIYAKAKTLVDDDNASVTNIAYAMASKIKKGDATTPADAAKKWAISNLEKAQAKLTAKACVKRMRESARKHGADALGLGWSDEQLAGVFAAINALEMVVPAGKTEKKEAASPVVAVPVEATAQVDTQLAATSAPADDSDIAAVLAGMQETQRQTTAALAMLVARK